jgi:hypothetical protein
LSLTAPIRVALGLALLLAGPAVADEPTVAALVLARKGADANQAIRIERDLRMMFDHEHQRGKPVPRTRAIETRFDVGKLSKAEIGRARQQFDDAQRALEKGDADEALESLFRAERFYNKAVPYSSEPALLRGIYYAYYEAKKLAGKDQEAREAYCEYVAVARALAGGVGPIEQFEPLADACGNTSVAGTAELRLTSNVDGAHVYLDYHPVGVVGRELPHVDPFLPAGPHMLEVRKAGYARWGTLVNVKNGKSVVLKADLEPAKNRADEFDPLNDLVFKGDDAFGDAYIADLFFQMADRYHVDMLVVGYLEPQGSSTSLTLFTYTREGVARDDLAVAGGLDGHRPALSQYWKARFGYPLNAADALPAPDRFAPTLFKVE